MFENAKRKIEEHQNAIKNLEQEIYEKNLAYMNLDPEEIKIAEVLHTHLCNWNHTDGCSWFYESWEDPGCSKKDYLEKAKRVKSLGYTGEMIDEFFKKVKG